MPVEADVVAYLAAAGLGLTAGTNLFEGPMPEGTAYPSCVAVWQYATERSDDYTMGASLTGPGSELEHIQVMTRDPVKATCGTRADAIHAVLDNLQTTTLVNGRTYFWIVSDGPPFGLGQDGNLLWRCVANYLVRKPRA